MIKKPLDIQRLIRFIERARARKGLVDLRIH